jgi:tetratricopeptide (TPR) repeat protein
MYPYGNMSHYGNLFDNSDYEKKDTSMKRKKEDVRKLLEEAFSTTNLTKLKTISHQILAFKNEVNEIYVQIHYLQVKARIQKLKHHHSEEIKSLFTSLNLSKEIGDVKMISLCYNSIGITFWEVQNLKKAREYFSSAIEYSSSNYKSIGNLGTVLTFLGEHDNALEFLQK